MDLLDLGQLDELTQMATSDATVTEAKPTTNMDMDTQQTTRAPNSTTT